MRSKRAKPKIRPVRASGGTNNKPSPEKCWYCGFNADAGAEAAILLTKPDEDFQYFISDPEQVKQIITQVEIPRCSECEIAHNKVNDPRWKSLVFCLAGVVLLGVYAGIFIKTLSWWTYLAIGLGVSGAVIGIGIGVSRNFFMLPGNIRSLYDVNEQKQVQELLLKDWKVKL